MAAARVTAYGRRDGLWETTSPRNGCAVEAGDKGSGDATLAAAGPGDALPATGNEVPAPGNDVPLPGDAGAAAREVGPLVGVEVEAQPAITIAAATQTANLLR